MRGRALRARCFILTFSHPCAFRGAGSGSMRASASPTDNLAKAIKHWRDRAGTIRSMERATPDRLRRLIDTILAALDERIEGDALAKRAYLSRFHFDRLVTRGLGEAPATFRRRLLLERAAWRLLQSINVTDAGLDAGYGSTEAFSRAFTRAYGLAPSRFAIDRPGFRLSAPNGIHFHPPPDSTFPATTGDRPWT